MKHVLLFLQTYSGKDYRIKLMSLLVFNLLRFLRTTSPLGLSSRRSQGKYYFTGNYTIFHLSPFLDTNRRRIKYILTLKREKNQ